MLLFLDDELATDGLGDGEDVARGEPLGPEEGGEILAELVGFPGKDLLFEGFDVAEEEALSVAVGSARVAVVVGECSELGEVGEGVLRSSRQGLRRHWEALEEDFQRLLQEPVPLTPRAYR